MNKKPIFVAKYSKSISLLVILFLGLLLFSLVPQKTFAASASDSFNRANGSLGSNWTNASDAALTIKSDTVAGTLATGSSGDYWTASSFTSNQYSQIQITSTQLTGGQWIGPSVRVQNNGLNGYVGVYFYNNNNPKLEVFKRSGINSWTLLGSTNSAALTAGTKLKLVMMGNTFAFLVNGIEKLAGNDSNGTYTGGAPGIMAYGTGKVDNWSGGDAGYEFNLTGTDANGVQTYDVISANNGYGPQVIRILKPTNPTAGVGHNFIYTLPVQPGVDNITFGDGLDYLQSINAQNTYNVTIIEPSFYLDPWYANNPKDPNIKYETFMTKELQPWVQAHLASSGTEQHWLIGFSKSGYGGMNLLLKHPTVFTVGAFWDFPADMTYTTFGSDTAANYGTQTNFQNNYQLTASFVNKYKTPFTSTNRIWIGSYGLYQNDMADFDALLTAQGIPHTTETPTQRAHVWTSGWVTSALSALAKASANQ